MKTRIKNVQTMLLSASLLLTGCVSGTGEKMTEGASEKQSAFESVGAASQKVQLEIFAWQDEEDNLTALAQAYMEQNESVSIHTNFVPISEYSQQMMSLRNGNRQVDCCFFPSVAEANIWQNKCML